ncbi:MAG: hypothetical protein A3G73_05745 [Rhodospirillales bacterium RIFCSPLOWO2_12_FULL_67_15]|nr:MAG: hypothetical protein A3G73_05745 [Rhodospirillales bacterium RIFCSPLOWO2_12_FULL_67_15]
MIRTVLAAMFALAVAPPFASAGEKPPVALYKNPQCDCCEGYADYLRQNGYKVTVKPTHDLSLINRQHGVPEHLEGCHTTLIGGYVVEGHVPVKSLDRLLTERPAIKGISLPGMPQGSPGMTGRKSEPFTIYELSRGTPRVYAVE